ncbi:putative lipase/esterase enzyme from carbohydrate esterase family CE10 [Rhizoctonia solani AG-1 IA]|uniref:Putative lipase/esterase enzyme from carbohydrate esterase family CE10 n=1 Tax=Thanatephorus cucumeris (strain AG1-IA) TaxID=983506 RepID=L8WRY0_THACA|nr:putative lipase/esterase enzyme from carbohydrate esterase family CE10 [Rhizoctonia solani AG-1 IA]
MTDPSTFNGPIHPDLAPRLDAEYAAFHSKYLADRPAIHKLPWDPACRVGPINLGGLEPCKVGSVRDLSIPGSPPVNVRVFTPPGEKPGGGWPVLAYFHGGGWVLGNIDTENSFSARTCLIIDSLVAAKCVVVSVDYRLAPEHVFPAAVGDSWAAVEWIHEHGAAELDIDPSKIAVGGSSAWVLLVMANIYSNVNFSGGNLSAVVTQRAVQRSPPLPIKFQVLIVPVTDNSVQEDGSSLLPTRHESWVKWKNTTPLTPEKMMWFRENYLPDKSKWTHVDASPLFQKDAEVWSKLPDAWVGVAELDILKSEGEAYAQKLKEAGKKVEVVVYPGEWLALGGIAFMNSTIGAPHSIMAMDGEKMRLKLYIEFSIPRSSVCAVGQSQYIALSGYSIFHLIEWLERLLHLSHSD